MQLPARVQRWWFMQAIRLQEYSVKKQDSGDTGCDVSPEIARQSATVVVHAGDKVEVQSSCRRNSDER